MFKLIQLATPAVKLPRVLDSSLCWFECAPCNENLHITAKQRNIQREKCTLLVECHHLHFSPYNPLYLRRKEYTFGEKNIPVN